MDQRLKERLIGAVVLVALAVWLIPWLLDGPERETVAETVALELPAAEESAPVKTVTVDLDDRDRPGAQAGNAAGRDERAGAAPESGPAFGDASGAPGDTAVASEPPASPADPEREPVAEADAETAGTRAASNGEGGGSADAGAEESGGGADAGAGEPGREVAEAAAGEGREAAEAAADGAGTDPGAGRSVPAGTASAGDWAVQLGSFGEIANAERLAARVETFGYEPEVSTHTAGGRELHRVRVGPQPSRARAEAVVSALTAHGFVAQVVTAD